MARSKHSKLNKNKEEPPPDSPANEYEEGLGTPEVKLQVPAKGATDGSGARTIGAPKRKGCCSALVLGTTLLVVGDWDSVRIGHATAFFQLLGGGSQDGGWDGSGMNRNRFAVLPGATHYTIFSDPRLATTTAAFLDT